MTQCTLSSKIQEGFQKIESMKVAEVDALFSEYDRAVFATSGCANADRYVLIAEQFQRHNKFDLANLALAKAMLVGPSSQLPFLRIAAVYSKIGLSELSGVLKYIGSVQKNQATTVAFPQKGTVEYWQAVSCDDNLEQCRDELKSTQVAFNQNLKRQLLLSLYANYYHLAVRPEDITAWLWDPVTLGAWKRDPKIVVEVLDYFVQKREIELQNGESGAMGNSLLVIRDLLKLTSQFWWTEPVHHPDLKAFFKPYYDDKGHLLTSVGEGVAFYLFFLLQFTGGQVPDPALMVELRKMSRDKEWAGRVEQLATSRNVVPATVPVRKKK